MYPDAITATLCYAMREGVRPVTEYHGPGHIHRRRVLGALEEHSVRVADGRPVASELSLDRHGFVFVSHASAVTDFFDPAQVKATYYSELERLARAVSGAFRCVVYDHILRSADPQERERRVMRQPVPYAHNDYTEASAPRRLRELLPQLVPGEADALLGRRFAVIQAWRPIRTVRADPLAVLDARTVRPEDLIEAERRLPERVVENYRLAYRPEHRWFYFPAMRPDEVMLFKTFDSATDGRARFTPHAAFKDPGSPADAPPRQSIEARLFAFFGDPA